MVSFISRIEPKIEATRQFYQGTKIGIFTKYGNFLTALLKNFMKS